MDLRPFRHLTVGEFQIYAGGDLKNTLPSMIHMHIFCLKELFNSVILG